MTEYDNTNRGSIWKNEKKDPERDDYKETLPDFTGELDVDGVKFFVDAWKRKPDAKPKAPALTFKVKRKDQQSTGRHSYSPGGQVRREDPISTGRPRNADMNDDIPFAPEFR
jgi:hypothetical protein